MPEAKETTVAPDEVAGQLTPEEQQELVKQAETEAVEKKLEQMENFPPAAPTEADAEKPEPEAAVTPDSVKSSIKFQYEWLVKRVGENAHPTSLLKKFAVEEYGINLKPAE